MAAADGDSAPPDELRVSSRAGGDAPVAGDHNAGGAPDLEASEEQPLDDLPSRPRRIVAVIVAVTWVGWQLYVAGTRPPNPTFMRGVHLSFAFTSGVLLFPPLKHWGRRHGFDLVIDLGIAGLSVALMAFIIREYTVPDFNRLVSPEPIDMVVGFLVFAVVIYLVWRTSGLALAVTSLVFLMYGFFGQYIPSPVGHQGFSVARVVSYSVFRLEGMFGVAVAASAILIFPVLIFGGFLLAFGGGTFFAKLALSFMGHVRGGSGKVAVVASGLFATVTGTGSANVATTGVFTIPLMIRSGYKRTTAAAIESSASIGGQILPPVMGAAGFVMAELMGITYAEVVRHVWLPALLFFASLYWRVHLEAERFDLELIPKSDLPDSKPVLKEGWHFLVSMGVLIYLLAIVGRSVPRSAFFATVVLFVLEFGRRLLRRQSLHLERVITGCVLAARGGAVVGAATAAVMIVISMIGISGIGIKLSSLMISLAGGSLLALLLLTAVASILLGTGLPTVPTYLVLAVLAAPTLVQFGVPPIAAHLFVLYYGTWGDLTPPVALGPTVAAGIAESPLLRTMVESMRVGLVGLLLPFAFVYSPELLLLGSPLGIVFASLSSIVAVYLLVVGLTGYFKGLLGWAHRLLAIAAGLAILAPNDLISVVSLVFGIIYLALRIVRARRLRDRVGVDVSTA